MVNIKQDINMARKATDIETKYNLGDISTTEKRVTKLEDDISVDKRLSFSSNRPVANKVITEALSTKVSTTSGKGLSTNDFTDTYKTNVDNNTTARHTHNNKLVLDGINSTDITNWNNKSNFSGDYDDLENKPTIPTVNNGKLTIGQNGVKINEFSANSSNNVSIDITTPTKTSDLTNDSDFATNARVNQLYSLNRTDINTINNTSLPAKQNTLISGTNIKTINGNSILGSGDITVDTPVKSEINCYSATQVSTTSSGPAISDLTVIPLTQNYKIGSKFTLSGNKIYIDSSVEKFEISAKVYFFSGNSISDLGRLNIIKNGNTYLASALGMVRNYTHVSLIPTVIENDDINYIELRFNNGGHTGVKQGIETKESTFIRVKEL